MENQALLTVTDLTVSYETTAILHNINLLLHTSQKLAIIGESGAGKTSLALTIAGLCPGKAKGSVALGRTELLTLSEAELRQIRGKDIALVFQNSGTQLHPHYQIIDQVAEAILIHNNHLQNSVAYQQALEALLQVGLSANQAQTYPHQLSGGQQQRAFIAMALVNNPKLLLLDEPTASLDPLTKQEITALLKETLKERAAIIITHDITAAAEMADSIAVLYGGRIVEAGSIKAVLENPRHPYTRGLLRAYPNMTTVKDLQGIAGRMEHNVPGCPFHPRCTQRLTTCTNQIPALTPNADRQLACHRGGILPVLEVHSLTKTWENCIAVNNLSLTLYEGETLSIVGESGSGKTTLAKTIMGLISLDSGQLILNGSLVAARDKAFYKQIQLVFQNPKDALSHRLTVYQLIKEPLVIHNVGSEADKLATAKELLAEVELPGDEIFLHKYPHQLSGGEAQRVVIARALALDPKILIADEPTSALDASIQAKVVKLLLTLQEKRGLALLFITHDLALARKISDRIIVMQQGRVVEEGAAAIITSIPKHPYTQKLLSAAAHLNAI
ncbi:ABC transporter ATP-binding protein [Sporomusa malonica]|uniref:Nickel import system ATP-binding protein NikD n=1 Tax=Sporomusa malonica TaxID=112901 RepID=A0A1W2EJR7_9FIRM|nr:ABC transporter ATP-binding protein [Sporomusa malonica]SMD09960.1 peptide/nickel transport system ATP-binding protein [Sporomusa malonica]